jgi:predicted  nucleic acid-binding Zn-ribbon protein
MVFAPLSYVSHLFAVLFHWLEEVWQDTVNLRSEITELSKQLHRIEAGLAHMQEREKRRDFAMQHAILREENALLSHRLHHFQTLAPDTDSAVQTCVNVQKCLSQALHAIKMIDDKIR